MANPQSDKPAWQTVVAQKIKLRDDAVRPYLEQQPGPNDEAIRQIANIESLAEKIAKAEFSVHDVVSAYVRR